MDQRGDEIHASTTEASGGSREGVVRWVLVIGLLLVVALLSIIWITGALTQDDGPDSQYNLNREIQETESTGAAEGEPIMPGPETGNTTAGATGKESNTRVVTHPQATATPGDAPAGDPTNTAQ